MLDFKEIWQIRKDAIKSIKSDSDNEEIKSFWKCLLFEIMFLFIPMLTALGSWCKNVKISSIDGFIGTTIAVFTGLFFSLLLSIGSKVKAEQDNPNKDSENFQRFKTNMKQIADIIIYVILIGVVVFVLMILNTILNKLPWQYTERLITSIAMFLMTRFIIAIFFMLQRFRSIVSDEISNIL